MGLSLATLTFGAITSGLFRPLPAPESAVSTRFELPGAASFPAWSADGRQVAWIEQAFMTDVSRDRIVVRRLDEFQSRTVVEGEGRPQRVAFSPDGQWLAYAYAAKAGDVPNEIRKVRVAGGASDLVASIPATAWSGLSLVWDSERVLLSGDRELLEAPAAGGTLRPVLVLPEGQRFAGGGMQIINGGRDLLFVGGPAASGLWTVPMAGGAPRLVLEDVMSFRVTATGHLLHSHPSETHLFGRRFREDTIEVQSDSVPLLAMSYGGLHAFGLSLNGNLAYSLSDGRGRREVVWLDRATGRVDLVHDGLPPSSDLSPDGEFLLSLDGPLALAQSLRVRDLTREREFVVADDVRRFHIADHTRTLFFDRRVVDGTSSRTRLFRVEYPWTATPTQVGEWSDKSFVRAFPDARRVVLQGQQLANGAFFIANADGRGTPVPAETDASPSPDGRWVAYFRGQTPVELWVRSEPEAGNSRWLLSGAASVTDFFWSGDGRGLFYADDNGQWHSVTVRGPRPDAPFALGQPAPVKVPADVTLRALTPDGTRFLAVRFYPAASPNRRMAIVQNFFEELRAKVAVK